MSWTVRTYDPTGATLRTEALNGVLTDQGSLADEGEVALRRFDAPIVIPPGSGRVLNLYAKQSVLQAIPRGIVQFLIDDTPVFWGPAVVVPTITTPGAGPFDQDRDALERITVLGGEQLLKDTVIGPRLFEEETDVAAIALELCTLYAHPALTVDEDDFVTTGAVLSVFYAPEKTLFDALAGLTETVPGGATFWVDATGSVHFEAIEPAGS